MGYYCISCPLSPSLFSASLLITIHIFHYLGIIGLVYSIHDSTEEVAIQKMIDASQRMITINRQGRELGRINPTIKRHLESEI
jgi:hypothetical protein